MTRDPGEVLQTPVTSYNILKYELCPPGVIKTLMSSPLDKESHSIWVTLMLKDRSNEAPEETTVRTMGLLLSSPMSTYTASGMSESQGVREGESYCEIP